MYLNNVTSTGFANSDAQAPTIREATIVQHLTLVEWRWTDGAFGGAEVSPCTCAGEAATVQCATLRHP